MPTTTQAFSANKVEPIWADEAKTVAAKLAPSTTFTKGEVMAYDNANDRWDTYSPNGANGLNVARGIMVYECITDADGKVSFGTTVVPEHMLESSAPVYVKGTFRQGDLPTLTGGDEVQTVTISGTLTAGQFKVGAQLADGSFKWSEDIAYNANLAAIQAGYDTVFGASKVVIAGTVASHTVTFSGVGYTKIEQPPIELDVNELTGITSASVAETTKGFEAYPDYMVADLGRKIIAGSDSDEDLITLI